MVIALLAWPLPEAPQDGISGSFLIRDVSIVDVESGLVTSLQSVLVVDGKIASISATGSIDLDGATRVVDGTGKFLIPSLWDMHTHSTKLAPVHQHPLLIANGITGVRDLWGCMNKPDPFFACIEDRQAWNEATANQAGLSPRYVGQSSFQINGGSEVPKGFPDYFKARNPLEARQLVAFFADAGADILKVYSEISPAAYFALADEARARGLSLEGHRPLKVSLADVLAADQRSVEHARLFLFECYRGADEFRALNDPLGAYTPVLRARLVDEHDSERCRLLMQQFAESNTWWTPTLLTLRMGAMAGDSSFRTDPRLKYIPDLFLQLMWEPDADRARDSGSDASGRNVNAEMYRLAQQHVGQAHAAGANLLAGTDVFDTYIFPGFSVHEELVELVAAGLSPIDALRTATINAATFSGVEDEFGSIEEGKAADMLLLNADPTRDIRSTQKIEGLFFNGQYYERSALDRLLEYAEQQAGSWRTNLHILWAAVRSPLLRVQLAD
ncbi:amidohydrolase family protein [Haliea sp.]|uniref:amidohydrolase family protein n=1 Tax=Haliea sp. TaxID=1932666 RepID=UPI0025B973AD|nr:amidohydrolase family protein [Haliea sp.]